MKARIRFAKTGAMRFVGHLDISRFFQKAFRRTGLPLSYSEGSSPHILLTFASPLSVGMTSEGEYMDIVLAGEIPLGELWGKLSAELVDGLAVTDIVRLKEDAKTPMAILRAASYQISPGRCDPALWAYMTKSAQELLAEEKILMLKKSKKGEREVDIRPLICDLYADGEERIMMTTAAGSTAHLKPELVVTALAGKAASSAGCGPESLPAADTLNFRFHRTDLLGVDPQILKPGEPRTDEPLESLIALDKQSEA